jgi:hypothetical protein
MTGEVEAAMTRVMKGAMGGASEETVNDDPLPERELGESDELYRARILEIWRRQGVEEWVGGNTALVERMARIVVEESSEGGSPARVIAADEPEVVVMEPSKRPLARKGGGLLYKIRFCLGFDFDEDDGEPPRRRAAVSVATKEDEVRLINSLGE